MSKLRLTALLFLITLLKALFMGWLTMVIWNAVFSTKLSFWLAVGLWFVLSALFSSKLRQG